MQDTQNSLATGVSAYRSVLLVDDDAYSLALTQTTLECLGIQHIVTASDGAAGIRAFDRMRPKPDLVVCDLYMPDKDGIEFINELGSRQHPGALILMTGGDLGILEIASKVAVGAHGLQLLGAFAKPLVTADMARVLGLPLPTP
jgi:CheY-like chemotaxis protein